MDHEIHEKRKCSVEEFSRRRYGNSCVEDGEMKCKAFPVCKGCPINYESAENDANDIAAKARLQLEKTKGVE